MNSRSDCISLIKKLLHPLSPLSTELQPRLTRITVKAVIFDIYGTLLISKAGDVGYESMADDEQHFHQALIDGGWDVAEIGRLSGNGARLLEIEIKKMQQERYRQGSLYPEINIRQIWLRVLSSLELSPGPGQNIDRAAISYECRTNPIWPMPGMVETLARLKEKGVKLGIISNAQFYTPLLFEALTGSSPEHLGFDTELTLWSYKMMEGKPSPLLFEHLNSSPGLRAIEAEEILYVGNDMLKDIRPAAKLGWKTALFAGDNRSLRLHPDDVRIKEVQPDMIINDLHQLLNLVQVDQ